MIELDMLRARAVLDALLMDRTTGQNIIWATDTYESRGEGYGAREPILPALVTGENGGILQPRTAKAAGEQAERTRKHAEVFTPAWVCNRMVNHCDEEWFGRGGAFNVPEGEAWTPTAAPVAFPRRKRWQRYVDSRRLEITCGEAPFLVSRYDAATGEPIPFERRVGILDRKLRVVNERAADEAEWLKYAFRALESVYGYEYQGDNLLIARVNVLLGFADALRARWRREPSDGELRRAANIVSWNLWQMDGLKGTPPLGSLREAGAQVSIWELLGEPSPPPAPERPPCRIYDWRGKNKLTYTDRMTRRGKELKFDFVIGNPPYQEETSQEMSSTNGQTPKRNVFQHLQIAADKIAGIATVLIYPAGRWIHRSGKGLEEFGFQQINDPRLKKIIYYPDSRRLFPGIELADGLGIVIKRMDKTDPGFLYEYVEGDDFFDISLPPPGYKLLPLNPHNLSITRKVDEFVTNYKLAYLHDRILPRTLFGIESNFIHNNPGKAVPLENMGTVDYKTQVKLFTNDKAGKAGRAKWFVVDRSSIPNGQKYIDEWQVIVSSANAGGQKRDSQMEIVDNHSAFGRSRVALASFKTQEEAMNFFNYAKTYIVRFMFLMTDEALTSLGKQVPDIMDYTSKNGLLDFSGDLNEQLYKIIGLSEDEVTYVEQVVNGIRGKKAKEMA